jgi:lipopolysaccharide/colanic/teichoic acid biosynthesis glycosyltransferase
VKRLVYIGENKGFAENLSRVNAYDFLHLPNVIGLYEALGDASDIAMILADLKLRGLDGSGVYRKYQEELNHYEIPFGIIADGLEQDKKQALLGLGIIEVYNSDTDPNLVSERIPFLSEMLRSRLRTSLPVEVPSYKIPIAKRVFDLIVAGIALILASPVILLSAIALRIESRGPTFYISKRVGTGYKVFDFYKLRTMYVDADQRIKDIKHLNQYAKEAQKKAKQEAKPKSNHSGPTLIYKNGETMNEEEYLRIKRVQQAGTFVKIKDDPRITKVGMFLRNTSIDELPQLINVLKGDMSIVGNRPLPLYEAEQLTSDDWGERFLAPAGITGLWQVMKRGKGSMSEEERKALDNAYARKVSLWNDIRLIFKTIPALFQKENV